MDKSKSYKTEVSEMLVATYHTPGFGNLPKSKSLSTWISATGVMSGKGAVRPGEEHRVVTQ